MFFLPAKMKNINAKMKALEWSQRFFHYESTRIFPFTQWAANSAVPGPILLNFEPIQDFVDVLIT